ncbi:hypothetical protein Poly21_55130 [Allorhodopirellula heiligendammensis]|uniref:DUF1349 domain-containing protein n=2 Tax=Allorhodopirellula heiligendammensis TaxID=2714739 RepID=A0A5C6BCK0_9BACT|nr:hypothetical protein Poly21_55130 [Allorhodopirellula heiligendammensis]
MVSPMAGRSLSVPSVMAAAMLLAAGAFPVPACGEAPAILLSDAFDGGSRLDWQPVRPDPSHVSLERHPGKLTITTQAGSIGGRAGSRPVPLTQNLYLVANPTEGNRDFVITTCIESFLPRMKYQQAGVLVYDDDDNYLKCGLEASDTWVGIKYMRETDGFRLVNTDDAVKLTDRIWIRITKRGNVYERSYSSDGKTFRSQGEEVWGNGRPTWIGIVATNGSSAAEEIEAQFDFFEVRELTQEEHDSPAYEQRRSLEGTWTVTSTRVDGQDVAVSPISEFTFDGGKVSFSINGERMQVDYSLNLKSSPRGFTMSSLTPDATQPVNGVIALHDGTLIICLSMPPGSPAPRELATQNGDGRLLMALERKPD